jgi:hypothetical protein
VSEAWWEPHRREGAGTWGRTQAAPLTGQQ